MITLEEAEEWIEKQEFVYAKSYSKTFPHFYTTRSRCDEFYFEQFIRLIREHGIVKGFFEKQYVYLELDGFEYWEMGRPINCVQVLNKAPINDLAYYRKKRVSSEDGKILKAKLNMRECYIQQLINKKDKTEKDHNQLEFLFNTTRRIHGGGKNIIDHSKIDVRYE